MITNWYHQLFIFLQIFPAIYEVLLILIPLCFIYRGTRNLCKSESKKNNLLFIVTIFFREVFIAYNVYIMFCIIEIDYHKCGGLLCIIFITCLGIIVTGDITKRREFGWHVHLAWNQSTKQTLLSVAHITSLMPKIGGKWQRNFTWNMTNWKIDRHSQQLFITIQTCLLYLTSIRSLICSLLYVC